MAIFEGIGRALTSIGSDMQRNRLEREKREEFFADRTDARAYAEEIRGKESEIRAGETRANRDWSLEQERLRREWEVTEGDRREGMVATRTAAQNAEVAVRADKAAGVARDVVAATEARSQEIREAGVGGMRNISRAGQPRTDIVSLSGTVYPDARPEDWAAMQEADLRLPTPATLEQPTTAMIHGMQDEATEFDDEGGVVGRRGDYTRAFNKALALRNRQSPVPPPQDDLNPFTGQPFVRDFGTSGPRRDTISTQRRQTVPEPIDPTSPMVPGYGATSSTGQPDIPPGIDPEEYRRMLDSGATPATIQQWIARQAGRGGR